MKAFLAVLEAFYPPVTVIECVEDVKRYQQSACCTTLWRRQKIFEDAGENGRQTAAWIPVLIGRLVASIGTLWRCSAV